MDLTNVQITMNTLANSIVTEDGDYQRIDFTTTIATGSGGLFYRVVIE